MEYSNPYIDWIPPVAVYSFKCWNIQSADLIMRVTDHDDFDYKLIEKESKLIVDTLDRFNTSSKIIKA